MKKIDFGFIACQSGKLLAKEVFSHLQNEIESSSHSHEEDLFKWINSDTVYFSNGEVKSVIQESIKTTYLYVFQLMADPNSQKSINDHFMALLTLLDTVRRNGNPIIRLILLQYPYCRQDRKIGYEGITAALIARIIELFDIEQIITFDLHNLAIEGFFFKSRLIHMNSVSFFANKIKKDFHFKLDNKSIAVAPDMGALKRVKLFADLLGIEYQHMNKSRNYQKLGKIESYEVEDINRIEGKNVFIIDDMVSTGGTLLKACRVLKNLGAKDIYLFVSFPFFDGDAIKNFQSNYDQNVFKKLIGTNAVSWGNKLQYAWYSELSVGDELSKLILNNL